MMVIPSKLTEEEEYFFFPSHPTFIEFKDFSPRVIIGHYISCFEILQDNKFIFMEAKFLTNKVNFSLSSKWKASTRYNASDLKVSGICIQ